MTKPSITESPETGVSIGHLHPDDLSLLLHVLPRFRDVNEMPVGRNLYNRLKAALKEHQASSATRRLPGRPHGTRSK